MQKSKPKNIKPLAEKMNFQPEGVLLIRNLKRHKAVTLRMTPEEFDYFQKQMAMAKQKTQTDFFLAVLNKKPIIVITDYEKVLAELKRHGNNLNQISKALHETATFGEGAKKVMNECWKSYRAIYTLRGDIINALIQGERSQVET